MSLQRAVGSFVVSAVVAGIALWLVMTTTSGWGTFRGICATIVGTTLLLMILMARAGRDANARNAPEETEA